MCYCGNMGVEKTLNKSQYRKLTPESKILYAAPVGSLPNELSQNPFELNN